MMSMTEEKTKKREWVKNAAIIFLVILLILTFFSNTIMNWSLPEVSIKYVSSGTINAQIRGTGTVTASESYEVSIDESRVVKTVYAKVGEEVNAGDLLFVLSDDSSDELKNAEDTLYSLQLDYQRSILQATSFDYAKDDRTIAKLNDEIAEKTQERDEIDLSETAYNDAKAAVAALEEEVKTAEDQLQQAADAVEAAQDAYNTQQKTVDDIRTKLSGVSQGSGDYSGVSSAEAQLKIAKENLQQAKDDLSTVMLLYRDAYSTLVDEATQWIIDDYNAQHTAKDENGNDIADPFHALSESAQTTFINEKLTTYLPAQAKKHNSAGDENYDLYVAYSEISSAEDAVTSAEQSVSQAQLYYSAASDSYYEANSGNSTYNKYYKELTSAQDKLSTLEANVTAAQKVQTAAQKTKDTADKKLTDAETELSKAEAALEENKTQYKSLTSEISSLEDQVADQIFNLAQTKKSDNITSQLEELNFTDMRKKIQEQQEIVDKLTASSGSTEIYAEVNGVIQSVAISAGNTTTPGTALATIEVPDMGYTTEISVTTEQAQKVQVGTYADVSTSWWGSYDITARLAAIRVDTKNPRTNKLLVFELTGSDVESGNSITLSIGEKSQSYDMVVPKSAIRNDSNGNFVLMVEAKSSPLGNRYVAKRIDVTVVAQDDVNCAITGGITTSDCVITNSTAPVESGTQVRMAEG
jgi:multidrug efflux pump subunit AcrA (membrane-fusion protein)